MLMVEARFEVGALHDLSQSGHGSINLLKYVAETGAAPDLNARSNCSHSPSRLLAD